MKKETTDKNYDLIFKLASETFRHKMLDFLGIDAPEIEKVLPTELPDIEANIKQTDFVFQLVDESLLHLEFQTGYNEEDTYRFLAYDARLHKKYRRTIRTVVIYIKGTAPLPHRIEAGSVTYRTETVSMDEYDGDRICAEEREKIASGEKPDQLKLVFLPLMKSGEPASKQAKMAIQLARESNLPEEQIMSLISAIIVLADKILTAEDVSEIWEEISMLKVIRFAEEKGEMKGRMEGRMEGRTEGRMEGVQDIIYKQLLLKFKNIPAEYKEKLEKQDKEKLEVIGLKIIEMQTLEELEEYLM